MSVQIFRRPSAWLPLLMSLGAIGLILFQLATVGVTRQPDEGAAAHLFQLLMVAQIPIIAYFVIRHLPVTPKAALLVLAIQFVAGVAAFAPVWYFNW